MLPCAPTIITGRSSVTLYEAPGLYTNNLRIYRPKTLHGASRPDANSGIPAWKVGNVGRMLVVDSEERQFLLQTSGTL